MTLADTPAGQRVGDDHSRARRRPATRLTATPAGFTDVDGDALTYHYQWSLNGKAIDGATAATYTN